MIDKIGYCSDCRTLFVFDSQKTWVGGYGDDKALCPSCHSGVIVNTYNDSNRVRRKVAKVFKKSKVSDAKIIDVPKAQSKLIRLCKRYGSLWI